jgi:phosphoribosylglycinamide formyltransferase 2
VYEGLAQALSVPDSEVRLFGKPEAFISRRMGVALASAPTVEQARANAVKTANCIVVTASE